MLACRPDLSPFKSTVRLLEMHSEHVIQQRFGLILPYSGLSCNGCGSAHSEGARLGKSCNDDQTNPTLLPTHLLHIHVPQIASSLGDRGLQLQADLENMEVKLQQLLPLRNNPCCGC